MWDFGPLLFLIRFSKADLLNSRFDVNTALNFLAGPPARPRIVGIQRKRGTWFAADRRVSALIERQQRNRKLFAGVPHIARGPRGKGREFQHLPAAGKRE